MDEKFNTENNKNRYQKKPVGIVASTNGWATDKKIDETIEIELVKITTSGDKILDKPLYDIGGKSLFLKN